MCHIWQFPTKAEEEFKPTVLHKLPSLTFCNITGGEPFLREDIEQIIHLLKRKSKRIVISTNGYLKDRILSLAKRNRDLGIRISMEGLPSANDELRGLEDGFDHGLRTLLELRALGLKDLGLGITVSDRNAGDMIALYRLAHAMGLEFATASVHNSYYFHKHDNAFEDPERVAREFEKISSELLKTGRVKNWFRAYFNCGMANYIRGGERLLPCGAGKDLFFLDPYGRVMPCNGTDEEMPMGDLTRQSFEDIWTHEQAQRVRAAVQNCGKRCWMIGSVSPAMRKEILTPLKWVIRQKLGRKGDPFCE